MNISIPKGFRVCSIYRFMLDGETVEMHFQNTKIFQFYIVIETNIWGIHIKT